MTIHTVYATWAISFTKLSSSATQLLELLCFMLYEAIPSRIFEDAWKVYKETREGAIPPNLAIVLSSFQAVGSTWDILRFRILVKEILSFSLIEFNTCNHTFSLHPLVQQWAQCQCRNSREIICSTQTLLSLATPRGGSKDDLVITLSLPPHLRAPAQTGLYMHFTLLHYLSLTYDRGGMFQESATVYKQEQLKIQENSGVNNLACTYSDLAGSGCRTQILGDEHPDTIASMNNLACTYSDLCQDRDALALH
ncbi:hypothetical protein DL96DRAFT_1713825 [Flagelloscypha sp. PMI_526]|nr:hypothetical protein DL96DRAFT_1713825 [Flagelloscypha sp. PMI_526]